MRTSAGRILTTHVGSLPPMPDAGHGDVLRETEQRIESRSRDDALAAVVDGLVRRQVQCGIDIVSNGEISAISIADDTEAAGRPGAMPSDPQDPARGCQDGCSASSEHWLSSCAGAALPTVSGPLGQDVANLLSASLRHRPFSAFMAAPSPTAAARLTKEFHSSRDDCLEALAEAMRPRYEAIVAAGFVLQIDSPDILANDPSGASCGLDQAGLRRATEFVEVANHALRNVPSERVRLHVCDGRGGRAESVGYKLREVLPVLMRAKPQGLLFGASGARYQPGLGWFDENRHLIPEEKILVPGVLDPTASAVEHPHLVASRILRFAALVGGSRVIAGVDCGFRSYQGATINPELVWRKLKAMAEGAAIASGKLHGAAA